MKHTAFSMAVAAALMGVGAAAQAAPAVVAGTGYGPNYSYGPSYVQYAPPAPMYEPAPAPRAGYTWASGHYEWRNGQYVWIPGHWMEARPGYVWQEARWTQDANGNWYLAGGNWVRSDSYAYDQGNGRRGPNGDLDRDGILNRYDNDRDGDGVANWDDDYPNNWNRS
jgi:hypothetical protein